MSPPKAEDAQPDTTTLFVAESEPRIRLDDIPAPSTLPKPELDDLATKEAQFIENAARKEQVRGIAQDTRQRKIFAERIFWLLCAWIMALFAILFLQGFHYNMFRLSDNVVLALIGGSTVNIIGVFLVVVRYLFPKK